MFFFHLKNFINWIDQGPNPSLENTCIYMHDQIKQRYIILKDNFYFSI